jgi:hypothetical protein
MRSELQSAARSAQPSATRRPTHALGLLGWLGLLNLFLALSPQLDSAYVWDDEAGSTIAGAAKLNDLSIPGVMRASVKALFDDQGRFFPCSSIFAASHYFLDRYLYKFYILMMVLVSVYVFSVLIRRITREAALQRLFLVLVPIAFQVRYGPDAILGFTGLMQGLCLWTTASLLCFWAYLETRRTRCFIASLLLFAIAILTYEVAYVFFLMHFALACLHDSTRGRWLRALALTLPFALLTVGAIALVVGLRRHAGMEWKGCNGAYQPSFAPIEYLGTLFKHCTAAVPGTYVTLSGLRAPGIIEGADHAPLLRGIASKDVLLTLWLVLSEAAMILAFFRRPDLVSKENLKRCLILGLLFWVLPGVMISFSTKYQATDWIDWGMSYLPVYLSALGMTALLSVACIRMTEATRERRCQRVMTRVLLSSAVALALVCNAFNLRRVVEHTIPGRLCRTLLEGSFKQGLIENLDGNSTLVADACWVTPSLLRMYCPANPKKVALPGTYLGEAQPHDFSGPLYYGASLSQVPFPTNAIREANAGVSLYRFAPQDRIFYLRPAPYAENLGYVILGGVANYRANRQEVLGAAGPRATVFIEGDMYGPVILRTRWNKKGTLTLTEEQVIPPACIKTIREGRAWRLIEVSSPTEDDQIDFISFAVVVNKTIGLRPASSFSSPANTAGIEGKDEARERVR